MTEYPDDPGNNPIASTSAEERTLRSLLAADPGNIGLVVKLCAVLSASGKPVPVEMEERALEYFLASDPNRQDLLLRLCAVLAAQDKPVPPELQQRALAASLAGDPQRADLAVSLASLLRRESRPLDAVQSLDHWCLTTDPHTRSLEPFIFMHIPKTAGSVMRLMVWSLFDRSRIFPGMEYAAFDDANGSLRSDIDPARHGVFVGHMRWDAIAGIEEVLSKKTTVLTVLRDPISHLRSQLAFVDHLDAEGTTSAMIDGQDFNFVGFWTDSARANFATMLLDAQVISILGKESPFHIDSNFTPGEQGYIVRPEPESIDQARALLLERLESMYVVFFEDLRRSLDLFCFNLEIPFQPISDLRLNSSFADHSDELNPEQLEQAQSRSSLSFEFDATARKRFEEAHGATFAGVLDVQSYLNARYRTALERSLEKHWCAHLSAENAWPGYGWNFREINEYDHVSRQLGPDGRGCIILRFHAGCTFIVSLAVQLAESEKLLSHVSATANGTVLQRMESSFVDGRYVLNWLMPSACLDDSGLVEIAFELENIGENKPLFSVAAIDIFPAIVDS